MRSRGLNPLMFCLIGSAIAAMSVTAAADDVDSANGDFFENNIRPLLVDHCVKCHGPKKSESSLRLDTFEGAIKGGDSGPALIPNQPNDSLILQAIQHVDGLEMPPDEKLDERSVAALQQWIQKGAAWPEGMHLAGQAGPQLRSGPITDEEREFWSFRPVEDPQPPTVSDSAAIRTDIDRFVRSRLADEGLRMRSAASKRTLIRRATFDLTGLPPTVEHVDAFLADKSDDAFQTVVDRLLASDAYGERWGRHWLDVVRYADTAGETADYPTPLSWKYRNWVIDAFNNDKPYDEFVREQISGDILADELLADSAKEMSPADLKRYRELLTATGFVAISRRFGFDVENYHHLTIQDTIDTVGQSMLGLSLGCARCHDHKYDPVSAEDYYAWYGIFESTRYSFPGSEEKKRPYDLLADVPPETAVKKQAEHDKRLSELEQTITQLTTEQNKLGELLTTAIGTTGFYGFESQTVGEAPDVTFGNFGTVTVAAAAQSPFLNVFSTGTRGLAAPGDSANNAFVRPIEPAHVSQTTPHLYYNVDFRIADDDSTATGAYRFYLGQGPGTSAAVELGVSATTFYVKNGNTQQAIRELQGGEWYNIQIELNLSERTYSGSVGVPGDLVTFSDIAVSDGWSGIIDHTFVDRFGPGSGRVPGWHVDNLAVSSHPFASVSDSAGHLRSATFVDHWMSYIENRRLMQFVENREGFAGYHVWQAGHLPLAAINVSDKPLEVPGRLLPGEFGVHPAENEGVGIAWRSPFTGKLRVTGAVKDVHDCGDGVAWFVDKLHSNGFKPLAAGIVERNSNGSLTDDNTVLSEISVQQGELIQLAILPNKDHGCDMTQIDFRIERIGHSETWDLATDMIKDPLSGNPHKDQYGNAATWYFFRMDQNRGQAFADSVNSESLAAADVATASTSLRELTSKINQLTQQREELRIAGPYSRIYGTNESDKPKDARIQLRGEVTKPGDIAVRSNLEILGGEHLPDNTGSGRQQLADWLTRASNPLTARVMANRIWQGHFGRGLVATENDFGARGELPSHPKLLDWLASRFVEGGWSVKAMHRLIMASSVYQQSCDYDATAAEADPDSKHLWRFNRRRLCAEEIRDAMLFVSGDLDFTAGREHPFPPEDTWSFSQHSPFYAIYPTQKRSVYLMQQRLKRHPFLSLFDGADPNASTARRDLTTVPTQALYLMNNEFVHKCANSLAKRAMAPGQPLAQWIDTAYLLTLGRQPTQIEQEKSIRFLTHYAAALPESDVDRERLAFCGLARTLLTQNEFLFVD